jgi:hypothetical protein
MIELTVPIISQACPVVILTYPERRFSPQSKADPFPSPNLGIGRLSFYVGFAPIKNLGLRMGAVLGIGGIKSASVHGTGL